jgi:hypothetical protein
MRLVRVSLAVAVAVAVAPVAAEAQSWSEPTDVGPPAPGLYRQSIAFDASGGALLAWERQRNEGSPRGSTSCARHSGYDRTRVVLATKAPGGPVELRRSLYGDIPAGPLLLPGERFVALRSFDVSAEVSCLFVSFGRTSGALTSTRRLAKGAIFSTPALAANARGDVIAAWVEYRAGPPTSPSLHDRFILRMAVKRRGHGFGRPRTLLRSIGYTSDHGSEVAIALAETGDAVVTFAATHRRGRRDVHLLDAFVRRGHGRFGRRMVVGPHSGFVSAAPLITKSGRVIVVWGTQDGGEEANRPWIVRSAVLASGAHRFGEPQVLDPGQGIDRPSEGVSIGADAAGSATVVWSGVRGARGIWSYPVMAARSDVAGHFGEPQRLMPDGDLGNVVVGPDGSAIVTWARARGSYQITDQVYAALRPAGSSTFGEPEAVATPDVAHDPFVAVDPLSLRPTVVWSAHPGASDPLGGLSVPAVLRVATRP